ncbi:hypothetical protein ABFX02_04G073900 [Erythranthe guttata]
MKFQAFVVCLLLLAFRNRSYADEPKVSVLDNKGEKISINIGVILDMRTWEGKIVHSCIKMAVSDFYRLNQGYRTRIALHVRDSGGDSLHSIAAALDLLENVEVQAIIIPKISNEELFLARLGDRVNVPLLSFSSISSPNEHPYFVQVAEDEDTQFHGIAAFLKAFRWKSFVFLYEDNADARQAQTYIHDILQENHLNLAYQTAISLQVTDNQIINELHKLMEMKASIILIHLSPSLASKVFLNAKILGMMSKGFAWIVTSKTMNLLDWEDSSVYESMQGVIGFRYYIPPSSKVRNLTLRLRREFQHNESNMEIRGLNVFGLWAYDAASVLAEAVERVGIELSQNSSAGAQPKQLSFATLKVSNMGSDILSKIVNSTFTGLLGKFQLSYGKSVLEMYEVLNVIGNGERRVGFWTSAHGLTEKMNPSINSSLGILETIIWPGFSSTAPKKRWLLQKSGKSFRIAVPENGTFPELLNWDYDQQRGATTVSGFCIDVFRAAVDRLPYKISFEYIPFDADHYSYNDLINQVYEQKYDAAVGDITILSNRSLYVDFTLPFSELGLGIIVKLNDRDPWFFLKPLNIYLWITSACFFFLTGFIIWLIEHRMNEEFQGSPAQQIGTALSFAASTLVYAHRENLKSNISRFVVGVWLFVVLILTSSYIAKLSSLLTVEQIKLASSDYIGYPANSFILRGISVSNLNFTDNRRQPYQSPNDYNEALTKGSKKGGVSAIVDELPYLKLLVAKYPNEYTIIDSSATTNGFGFAFQKGSPLVRDISIAIGELREEGKIVQMERKWFSSQTSLFSQDTESSNKAEPLGVYNFFGLFIINGVSEAMAILLFLVFLLREKMSIHFNIFAFMAGGKLMSVLRYFYPGRIIGAVDGR